MSLKELRAGAEYQTDVVEAVDALLANPASEPSMLFARLMKLGGDYDDLMFLAALTDLAQRSSARLGKDDTGTAAPHIALLLGILIELESRAGVELVQP